MFDAGFPLNSEIIIRLLLSNGLTSPKNFFTISLIRIPMLPDAALFEFRNAKDVIKEH